MTVPHHPPCVEDTSVWHGTFKILQKELKEDFSTTVPDAL